jgi:hypothetical protein
MTELILSEVTRMTPGHCVIGLEAAGQGFRSIRPFPLRGRAWPSPFDYPRGAKLRFNLGCPPAEPPHTEDRLSTGILEIIAGISEAGLVDCLRRAEVADELEDLFGCETVETPSGRLYTKAGEGSRSICGCGFLNIRLGRVEREISGKVERQIRASLTLPSGETLRDIAVVDRDWSAFVEHAETQITGANRLRRLNRFLRERAIENVLSEANHFARIGLSRPFRAGCWLMLDSLFPLPKEEWLSELDP